MELWPCKNCGEIPELRHFTGRVYYACGCGQGASTAPWDDEETARRVWNCSFGKQPEAGPSPEPSPERRLMARIQDLLENGDYEDERIIKFIHTEIEAHQSGEYAALSGVLQRAYDHAASGKGHQRHATGGKPFEEQVSCWIEREGFDYATGQAVKKLHEALRMEPKDAVKEIIGAINLCAIRIISLETK